MGSEGRITVYRIDSKTATIKNFTRGGVEEDVEEITLVENAGPRITTELEEVRTDPEKVVIVDAVQLIRLR